MRLMKIIMGLAILLAIPSSCLAQYTLVSGQILDPNSTPYINCSINANWVNQSGSSLLPLFSGGGPFQQTVSGMCDSAGNFTLSMADVNQLNVAPSQWNLSVCSAPQQQIGNTKVCFSTLLTITGATQTITTQMKAASVLLPINALTGQPNTWQYPQTFLYGINTPGYVSADTFPGADDCKKISNAIAYVIALNTIGGTVDARAFTGNVNCDFDPFLPVAGSLNSPITLLLGGAVYKISVTWNPNSGSTITGTGGSIGEGPSIPVSGTLLQWNGAPSLPILKYFGTSGTTFEKVSLDGNDIVGVIGIHLDSNSSGDVLSHGAHSVFQNFSIRNTEKAVVCGDKSDTASTTNNAFDLQRFSNFFIAGDKDVTATNKGFHINSSNCFDAGRIEQGSFVNTNISVDIINGGGPYFALDNLTGGNGTSLQSTFIRIGPDAQISPDIMRSHNEGDMYYAIHDTACSATMPRTGYVRAPNWHGNAMIGNMLIDGCDYINSEGNSGHGPNPASGGLWNIGANAVVFSKNDTLYNNPLTPTDTGHTPWVNSWTIDTLGNSGATRTANVATIKTTTAHVLAVGSWVSIAGVSDTSFVSSAITNVSLTGNVVTITTNNAYVSGQKISLTGLTTATYLNGFTVTITAATSTQFTAPFGHADDPGHADTGTATPLNVKITAVPSTTSFSFANVGPNVGAATAGGGTVGGGIIRFWSQDGTFSTENIIATTMMTTPAISMSGGSQQILGAAGQLDLDDVSGNIRFCRSSTNCSLQKFISGTANRKFEVTDTQSNFFDGANGIVGIWDATGKVTANGGLKAGASGSTIADTRELMQSVHSCGTTGTCANTANGSYREIFGTITLSGGAASLTGISTAFTSSSTFGCQCTDQTTAAACKAVPASGSSVTFAGTGSDVLAYVCRGN